MTLRSTAAGACSPADACTPAGDHCITCSDEAVPVTVVAVDANRELALCETADGRRETIEIALVSPVRTAERLLAHAGTAIARPGGAQ